MADDIPALLAGVSPQQQQPKPGEWRMPTWESLGAGAQWLAGDAVKKVMPAQMSPSEIAELWRLYQAGGLGYVNRGLGLLKDKRTRGSIPDTDPSAY